MIEDRWFLSAAQIKLDRGWSLRPLAELGHPREGRSTWLAEGDPGTVVVKVRSNPFADDRATWTAGALAVLRQRGYPVPLILWQGRLADGWFACVMERMPGEPLRCVDAQTLDDLCALVDLQTEPGTGSGGWDISWWISVVLFDGWEGWRQQAAEVAPEISKRLATLLEPAWGHRLPTQDIVHGDLNITNVLVNQGEISGVVDWDDMGLGSRAVDLTGLLFDWQRLQLADEPGLVSSGDERLTRRIVEMVGDKGLRCTIAYAAIARLALTAQRGEREALETWRKVTDALLDFIR